MPPLPDRSACVSDSAWDLSDAIRSRRRSAVFARNREEKAAAVPYCALHPDPAALKLDKALRDGETQAGAAPFHVDGFAAVEPLEDLGSLMQRYADPAVGDAEQHHAIRTGL